MQRRHPALETNTVMAGLAERHSAEMALNSYLSTTAVNGSNPAQILQVMLCKCLLKQA